MSMVIREGFERKGGRGERKLESHGARPVSTFALLQVSVVGESQTYWSILQVQLKSEGTST